MANKANWTNLGRIGWLPGWELESAQLHKTTTPNPIHRTASYKKHNFPKCEIALEPVYVGIGLGIREDLLEHLIKNHLQMSTEGQGRKGKRMNTRRSKTLKGSGCVKTVSLEMSPIN